MVGLGSRLTIERVRVGNSRPKAARACALLDLFRCYTEAKNVRMGSGYRCRLSSLTTRTDLSMQHETFFAPCPHGLEVVLGAELEQLGAQGVTALPGGVSFTGPFALCYAVNLHSRIASRVLWRVCHGTYHDEHDIFQAAQALPWPMWFPVRRTIKVKVSAQ